MTNPYETLPAKAFWRIAVAQRSVFDLSDLWDPKFQISPKDKVATFGSCFAQHIGRALVARGYTWLTTEGPPAGLGEANARKFNYGVFSARTGNIYTTSLLRQWVGWALSGTQMPQVQWERNGRYFDPFRPGIEPGGFNAPEELAKSRAVTLRALTACVEQADYFVFTLGLTESWVNTIDGYEYAVCPGTVAGEFDGTQHGFENQDYSRILANLTAALDLMRERNPRLRFLLTVSPVPLTATNSGRHVMVATMESKSILRAVAGHLAHTRDDVDYFPSYELINSPVLKGMYFQPNQRDVHPRGVEFVMSHFFGCQEATFGPVRLADEVALVDSRPLTESEVVCEEELLDAFAGAAR